jgi:glycine/D-amino acid oxidase-like deaminating enzyme
MAMDIIIVGQGLAGTILGYSLAKKGYSVKIFDDGENQASAVAAGLYNPITGKRSVKTWMADEIFPFLESYYISLQGLFKDQIFHPTPLYRPFGSVRESNEWNSKNKEELESLFVEKIISGPVMPGIISDPYGGIFLRNTGYVQVANLLDKMRNYFKEKDILICEKFDENKIHFESGKIRYAGFTADRLIFCTGLSSMHSSYFSWLPFKPVQGEILSLELETDIGFIVSKGIFIIPEGGKKYKAGSTYNRDHPYTGITVTGKNHIVNKVKEIIKSDIIVRDQVAGIRPATDDRRPFIGMHPVHKQIGIFNGFGSKGVSLIPYLSEIFIQHIESGTDIVPEINIVRYFN